LKHALEIPPATIATPKTPNPNRSVLGFSGNRIVARWYALQPSQYSLTSTISSSTIPATTIHSQKRNDECNDDRDASSVASCALKLDSSIEQIREDQSKILNSQAMAIAICGFVALGMIIGIHCANHYKINKKFVGEAHRPVEIKRHHYRNSATLDKGSYNRT